MIGGTERRRSIAQQHAMRASQRLPTQKYLCVFDIVCATERERNREQGAAASESDRAVFRCCDSFAKTAQHVHVHDVRQSDKKPSASRTALRTVQY